MDEEIQQYNKLFVGGISWVTTEESLRDHFEKFGTVERVAIAHDRFTGAPRGFAFVSFTEQSMVDKVLQVENHDILGRRVDVKRATPKGVRSQSEIQQSRGVNRNGRSNSFNSGNVNNSNDCVNGNNNGRHNEQFRTKKIFVGGLSPDLTQEEFKNYFEQFGRITDVVVMHDSITQRPRGFGFITFDCEESVEDVMMSSFHTLGGKQVEVKRAIPKEVYNNGYNGRGGTQRVDGNFLPYSPRYYDIYASPGQVSNNGTLTEYGSFNGYPYGVFGVGFPYGYGSIGYGLYPYPPRSSWNTPPMLGVAGSPFPYAGAVNFHSPYPNGEVGGTGVTVNRR